MDRQEPVAVVTGTYGGYFVVAPTNRAMVLPVNMALYAVPPRREWQGLTDEEIYEVAEKLNSVLTIDLARAIEAKLKEKNK